MIALIFLAGVLHGLGADHLVAITAVAGAGGGFQRITAFAARFALGHALVIVLAGAVAFFGKRFLPSLWEKNFELLAGASLVLGGVVLLVGLLTKRISVHRHAHDHHGEPHSHLHFHFGGAPSHRHVHGVFTILLGAMFALGGARTMLTATPIVLAHDGVEFFLRIAAFTAGIVISMTLFGALARLLVNRGSNFLGDPLARMRRLSFLTACLCIVAGLWTIASRVQS
jgi:nickel/cobalt exporter